MKRIQPVLIDTGSSGNRKLSLSPMRQVLANVATTSVVRIPLDHEIRTAGIVDFAVPDVRSISMRYAGRIEKIFLTYTGQQVHKGDSVVSVYSPDMITAQQEFLLASDSYSQIDDTNAFNAQDQKVLLDHAREKLRFWGYTNDQINLLAGTKQVMPDVTVISPVSGIVVRKNIQPGQYIQTGDVAYDVADLSTVWLYAQVYEYEMQLVKVGQVVTATCDAYPGRIFKGRIASLDPVVDPVSRAVKVRADIDNPGGELKVGMYVSTVIHVHLSPSLAVPASAVLSTGDRQIVWVQKSNALFEARRVVTSIRTREYVQILNGLDTGDAVVSSGGYLIDSESQLESVTDSMAE